MPFKSGQKPAITLSLKKLEDFVMAMLKAGYDEHKGRKVRIRNEIATLRKRFLSGNKRRQCHVQVICDDGKTLKVFAHTEPDMATLLDVISHGYSAIMDHASYQSGARMLKRDLSRVRFVS